MIDRDGNKHCSWCGESMNDERLRSEFCGTACAEAHRRDGVKRQRAAEAPTPADGFDWRAIRDMVRAPAYFGRQAQSSTIETPLSRGLSPEERGQKRARSRNGGEML